MPANLPIEKIIKIRREIRRGKSRRQLAKEMNLSRDTVCKYGKHITPGKINDTLKNIIREEVISGKTKKQVAQLYAVSYSVVIEKTKDIIKRIPILPVQKIKFIRKQVRNGKTKKQVSIETGIPYYRILKYTKDIASSREIPFFVSKRIKDMKQYGKSDKEIAEELVISETSVKKHRVFDKYRYCKYFDVPQFVIEEIRNEVKSGKDKLLVAFEMQISYEKVKRFTKDLPGGKGNTRNKRLHEETIKKIRREVKSGKPKQQVSRELGLSPKIVYYHTQDIIVGHTRDLGIAGKTLELLQEIMVKGYAKSSTKYQYCHYQKLRAKFPNIRRVKMYGEVIYFMQEKSDVAMRTFLENLNKKVISYQELQQIINVFQAKMGKKDKKKYLGKTN